MRYILIQVKLKDEKTVRKKKDKECNTFFRLYTAVDMVTVDRGTVTV